LRSRTSAGPPSAPPEHLELTAAEPSRPAIVPRGATSNGTVQPRLLADVGDIGELIESRPMPADDSPFVRGGIAGPVKQGQ
jgi:hypothetical protein